MPNLLRSLSLFNRETQKYRSMHQSQYLIEYTQQFAAENISPDLTRKVSVNELPRRKQRGIELVAQERRKRRGIRPE